MKDTMSSNKVLITGASGGLGSQMALYFSKKGHSIILHGTNEDKLRKIHNIIIKNGGSAKYIAANLNIEDDISLLCDFAKKEDVRILINNAGIICPNLPFKKIDSKIIDQMINVNLIAPIKIINALAGNLENIVNINSMSGIEARKNRSIYAASKWGLKGFSDCFKQEERVCKILDIYPTNIKTWPERENAMEIDYVLDCIYNAINQNKSELILDGRK
tara:strand:- start:166 stop:819 length:654 start_codon:yes stop_codon:yes gene_type:complete